MARAEAYLHAKFHLDPSKRLATINQRHRQTDRTGQTGQRSDSTGRTVLQTVAQKSSPLAGGARTPRALWQCVDVVCFGLVNQSPSRSSWWNHDVSVNQRESIAVDTKRAAFYTL